MSNASTIKYSSGAGVDWAALIAGLGLGLTVAMQVTTMSYSDVSSPYALITSFSRLCALVGTYFAVLGIFLIARIPFVERIKRCGTCSQSFIGCGLRSAVLY